MQIRIAGVEDRRKGFGTDATRLLLSYAFQDLNLRRVYLHVLSDNHQAIRVYEEVGFKLEGTLKQHCFIGGRYKDLLIMSILKGE